MVNSTFQWAAIGTVIVFVLVAILVYYYVFANGTSTSSTGTSTGITPSFTQFQAIQNINALNLVINFGLSDYESLYTCKVTTLKLGLLNDPNNVCPSGTLGPTLSVPATDHQIILSGLSAGTLYSATFTASPTSDSATYSNLVRTWEFEMGGTFVGC